MLNDVLYGLKLLWKEKAFAAAALLTLALCIGANTAVFAILNAVILDPLPYPDSRRLILMHNIYPGIGFTGRGNSSIPHYLDRRQLTEVFDSVALSGTDGYDVNAEGSPQRLDGAKVTPSYFQVFRASALIGRTFVEDDATALGKDRFVILSHGLWKDMFAASPDILGRDMRLSGVPYQIIGVMRQDFVPPHGNARLWVPFAFDPRQTAEDARHDNRWVMTARLKPGVTIEQARQRIDALNLADRDRFPKYRKLLDEARFATRVEWLKDAIVADIRPTLYLLQATAALVLLIGCVNIANLLLVRSSVRLKELAIRHSLGAGRWRLARQVLTESLVLATLGGLLGLAVGSGGVRLLAYLGANDLPRGTSIQVDSGVLAFVLLVSALTAIVFGFIPMFQLLRRDLNDVFRQSGRTGTGDRHSSWTRSSLVASQVAIAFILLIASGLLTLSFARLLEVDPGFRSTNLASTAFSLPRSRYDTPTAMRGFVTTLMDNLRAVPGVESTGAATLLPFTEAYTNSKGTVITIEGRVLTSGEKSPVPSWISVDSGYFRTMGIPLRAGRLFTEADTHETLNVAIIDESLARKHWPRGDALGARIHRGFPGTPVCTIIGVVGSVQADLASQGTTGQIYFHYKQFPRLSMHIVLRARAGIDAVKAIRSQIHRADPELPVFDTRTMSERLNSSLANRRAAMALCLAFAALALLLSAVGIYGVLAYAVTQRTREIGIRVALGATVRDVVLQVVRGGLIIAAVGLVIGALGALALTRLLTTMLYGVRPNDPRIFLAVAASLIVVALIASLAPSLRAVRIRPATALRQD
jgi:predicted permease